MRFVGGRLVLGFAVASGFLMAAFGSSTLLAKGGAPPPPKVEVDPNGEEMTIGGKTYKTLHWTIGGKNGKKSRTCDQGTGKHETNENVIGVVDKFIAVDSNGASYPIKKLEIELIDKDSQSHSLILEKSTTNPANIDWECRSEKCQGHHYFFFPKTKLPREAFDGFVKWTATKEDDSTLNDPKSVWYKLK
jgi:hypothetical protein